MNQADLKAEISSGSFLTQLVSLFILIGTVVGASVFIMNKQHKMQIDFIKSQSEMRVSLVQTISELATRVARLEIKTTALPPRDRWKAQDQIIWANALQSKNKNLIVPDPREVIRDRVENH